MPFVGRQPLSKKQSSEDRRHPKVSLDGPIFLLRLKEAEQLIILIHALNHITKKQCLH